MATPTVSSNCSPSAFPSTSPFTDGYIQTNFMRCQCHQATTKPSTSAHLDEVITELPSLLVPMEIARALDTFRLTQTEREVLGSLVSCGSHNVLEEIPRTGANSPPSLLDADLTPRSERDQDTGATFKSSYSPDIEQEDTLLQPFKDAITIPSTSESDSEAETQTVKLSLCKKA